MDTPLIYTIGHSNHPLSYFLELLLHYKVDCVVDVRSLPASRFNPQYNKKALTASLSESNIKYMHFGEEFGARQTDPNLLDGDGRVDFTKMRASEKFREGIQRLRELVGQKITIALMCSEGDPLHCHRFAMISPALKGFDIRHILKNKSFVGQRILEEEILRLYTTQLANDLFQPHISRSGQLEMAYTLLNKKIGYLPPQT